MICEELKDIEASTLPTAKLIHIISKNQMIYLKRELEDFDINVSQFHFLIEIGSHKYINQEKIASISNFDKGAVARSIKDLESKGLVKREIDNKNRRQNLVSLTSKGEEILNKSIVLLNEWEDEIFNINIIDKDLFKKVLKKMAINAIEINEKGE